jgi:5-methyltetrahydropteroyltriglutamate--homocysteine methyltransferase
MTDDGARMRTTHVGSLVRPDELIAYLRKIDAGEDYDEAAYQECLARSVREVVQAQRDAGIDIVSDGEFGKSAWNYYVYERLAGIELRLHPPGGANFASVNDAPTDWTRFPDFYAEYFAKEQEFESPGGDWACVAPVTYTGGEVIARDIANLKAAMDAAGVE